MHTRLSDLLLARRGLVFASTEAGEPASEDLVRAVEAELAGIGYAVSSRLRARLAGGSSGALAEFRSWACAALLAHRGGDRKHVPLFRKFPRDVPVDTLALWWRKVLVHFLQAEGQPCLFCRRTGATHVLDPCCHVVCDRCFDGANVSACPVCGLHVDRESPFFREVPDPGPPSESVTLSLLDLGDSLEDETRALFRSLCEREQALSPDDREALLVILRERGTDVLPWLPEILPVRENRAVVFGTLFTECDPAVVLPHAQRHMTTATDVLRFVAVLSGTDGSLQPETIFREVERPVDRDGFWRRIAGLLGAPAPVPATRTVTTVQTVRRFTVARLPRPLRRALLSLLESMDPERLREDMLRHRSWWVWIGQFLHPGEFRKRYPNVAGAFRLVRRKAPDGTRAPVFRAYASRLEARILARDVEGMLALLAERPGEFARRLDHAMRVAGDDGSAVARVVDVFAANVGAMATPVLVTLLHLLPTRTRRAGVRVFWPKGRVAMGALSADDRAVLSCEAIVPAVRAIRSELLRRFGTKPVLTSCLIDEALSTVMVPFNERASSPAAVSLPRGSRLSVPSGKLVRLFLHWCEPETGGEPTDLDLSVAFYDEDWKYRGVCSYYELTCTTADGVVLAESAGDLLDAPWPDGATEYVDLHRDRALAAGVRYAVVVVNAYSGMPFSLLDRGFAGLMLRDDPGGRSFDPRTVELKFSIAGENGIFMPLVLDVRDDVLHWLDVQARGQLEMNNVETSRGAIAKVCPALIESFVSGARPSMLDLGLLHAAARCERVVLRGDTIRSFARRPGESAEAFHERLVTGTPDETGSGIPDGGGPPLLALLHRGDVDLPEDSSVYALFRDRVQPTLAASDLLS